MSAQLVEQRRRRCRAARDGAGGKWPIADERASHASHDRVEGAPLQSLVEHVQQLRQHRDIQLGELQLCVARDSIEHGRFPRAASFPLRLDHAVALERGEMPAHRVSCDAELAREIIDSPRSAT